MKILINTPSLNLLGGVANHYLGLSGFWSENVRYNTVGKRSLKKGSGKYWLPYDIVKFILKLVLFQPQVVILNPSLGLNALKRDFIFLDIAHALRFKVVVFIHGFDWKYAAMIDEDWVSNKLNKASIILVLAISIKKKLQDWGITTPIELSTTKVDDKLLENFQVIKRKNKIRNILFLARIEENKGIFIALECFKILQKKNSDLTFTIVGDGSALDSIKNKINQEDISGVFITGRLCGEDLIQAYENADIYIFPSFHGEGMPTSVLEAMAFGLPVITRNVGGLTDFFNDQMGVITDSYSPSFFANAITSYIEDPDLTQSVSAYNAQYAKEYFMASKVALKVENTIKKYIS